MTVGVEAKWFQGTDEISSNFALHLCPPWLLRTELVPNRLQSARPLNRHIERLPLSTGTSIHSPSRSDWFLTASGKIRCNIAFECWNSSTRCILSFHPQEHGDTRGNIRVRPLM